jgi:hypothetical protein
MLTVFRAAALVLVLCLGARVTMSQEELDNSMHKLQLNAWVSAPTGYFNGADKEGYFDLERDFGFGNYVTFSGKMDWRFKRKHHFLFSASPVVSSRTGTINRTIDWQGQTFNIGTSVESTIHSLIFTPGYQWDFLRRRSIWIGLVVNVNLAYTDAKLKATAKVIGSSGSTAGAKQADGSLFAPLPALGPDFRWYPISSFGRFYIEGGMTAMSFFGYGNFVSGNGALGFPIGHHWDARAGYLLGSRFKIYGAEDNIGIRLTQKGPIFGLEYHWGVR